MERAHDAAKFGRLPDEPMLEATIPSLADPSLDRGRRARHARHERHRPGHAAHAPRHDLGRRRARRSATSSSGRSTATRRVWPGSVVARQVITPVDLERDYGLTGGHPMHGEHGLDQFFLWRPLLGPRALPARRSTGCTWRVPGSHPGGGVTGQNGQNAAREIVGDLKRRRRGTDAG